MRLNHSSATGTKEKEKRRVFGSTGRDGSVSCVLERRERKEGKVGKENIIMVHVNVDNQAPRH